jgi:protein kinase X
MLVADLSKSYGNLKGGVNDIKQHQWSHKIDWKNLLPKKPPGFYKPSVK